MFEKLESVEKRYEELTTKISDPAVIADNNEWRKLVKEHSSIEDVVFKYREYKNTINNRACRRRVLFIKGETFKNRRRLKNTTYSKRS